MPKRYWCSPWSWNSIIFGYEPTLSHHFLKINIEPFVLSWIFNWKIDFIVDFPTPSIVIHRPQINEPSISKVNFRMKQAFLGFVYIDALRDQSLEQHIVKNISKNGLISLARSKYISSYASLSSLTHGFIEFDHWIMVRLNDFNLFLRFIHHLNHTILYFISLCQTIIML